MTNDIKQKRETDGIKVDKVIVINETIKVIEDIIVNRFLEYYKEDKRRLGISIILSFSSIIISIFVGKHLSEFWGYFIAFLGFGLSWLLPPYVRDLYKIDK